MSERLSGTVKWFNAAKGYGFLEREDGGKDIFVHYSSIESKGFKTLNEGAQVSFVATKTPKGLQADEVRLV
jgi:cold shock protein